jgi:hypothetical protein
MRVFGRLLIISGLALVTLSLGVAQPAKAGDGGEDFGALQNFIDSVCTFFSMSSCPQTPTVTQAVLQTAALINAAPAAVRADPAIGNLPMGFAVDAINPARPPGQSPITVTTSGALPVDPGVLSTLQPLAFISATSGKGAATATQLFDSSADTFLYAVAGLSAANTNSPQPDTFVLFYDVPTRTKAFPAGPIIAKISLPMTVLNKDGTERAVSAVLRLKSPGVGGAPCSASTIVGDFAGTGTSQTLDPSKGGPAAIGVNCGVAYAPSPVSPHPHAIFEVSVPLLITGACSPNPCPPAPDTDPAYFVSNPYPNNPGTGQYPFSPSLTLPFVSDDAGFASGSGILGANGQSIGIAPTAAPLGPPVGCTTNSSGVTTCTPPGTYALCADLPRDLSGQNLVPSVAAFYAIATHGETLLATPLHPAAPGIVCTAM